MRTKVKPSIRRSDCPRHHRARPKLRRSTPAQQREARKIIQLVSHPVLADAVSMIRKAKTQNERFRQKADLISQFLLIEATRGLPTVNRRIRTPLTTTNEPMLKTLVVHFVSILRAGLALWSRQFLPKSRMGTIGIVREEEESTHAGDDLPRCRVYQEKLPPELATIEHLVVLDPMLATATTAIAAIRRLVDKGVKPENIIFVCVIAAVEGVLRLHQHFPQVRIIGAALDKHLTRNWYIYPGLGDFGCRYFGTDNIGL